MKKQLKHSSKLVYVHGTNGSGKSTLARAIIAAAGGVEEVRQHQSYKKAHTTLTASGLMLIGKYGTACGGVDGLSPYASILDILSIQGAFGFPTPVMAEGLITPGLETCQKMNDYAHGNAEFLWLAPPIDHCIANVLKRRARKGTPGEYDPKNLIKKRASAESWATRLDRAGLSVKIMPSWSVAYLSCLASLGLPVPDVDKLT